MNASNAPSRTVCFGLMGCLVAAVSFVRGDTQQAAPGSPIFANVNYNVTAKSHGWYREGHCFRIALTFCDQNDYQNFECSHAIVCYDKEGCQEVIWGEVEHHKRIGLKHVYILNVMAHRPPPSSQYGDPDKGTPGKGKIFVTKDSGHGYYDVYQVSTELTIDEMP